MDACTACRTSGSPEKEEARCISDRHSGTQPIWSTVDNLTTVTRETYHLSTHSTPATIRVNSVKQTISTVAGHQYNSGNQHRGWTHNILALMVWPFLLTGTMLGVDRLL